MLVNRLSATIALTVAGSLMAGCGTSHLSKTTLSSVVAKKNAVKKEGKELGTPATIVSTAQVSNGFSVIVKRVTIGEGRPAGRGGRVIIASDISGSPGEALASTTVKEGITRNVVIHLSAKLTTGRYFLLVQPASTSRTDIKMPLASSQVTLTVS